MRCLSESINLFRRVMPVQFVVQKLESSGILLPIRLVFVLNVGIGIIG